MQYISPYFMIAVQKKPIILPNGILAFKPEKKTSNYGFILHYQEAKIKISVELQLTFLGIENQNNTNYSITRSSIYVNNQPPDLILYEMANAMTNAIYPIEFTINQNIECISINNHKAILKRCEAEVQKMTHYYQSDIAQKIIGHFQDDYKSQPNLIKQIQNDLLFNLLFFPLHKSYTTMLQASTNYKWTFNDVTINFNIAMQIEKDYSENGKLVVQVASTASSNPAASYKASYHLDPEKHTLATATGSIKYLEKESFETLTFECYLLD